MIVNSIIPLAFTVSQEFKGGWRILNNPEAEGKQYCLHPMGFDH